MEPDPSEDIYNLYYKSMKTILYIYIIAGYNSNVKEKKENTYKKRKEEAAEKRKVQAALRRAEDTVERLEQQIQELEEQLCQPEIASDYEAALDLTRQAEALRAQHEEQMAVWEALCEQADTLEKES